MSLEIILIILVSFLAIVIVFLLLRKPESKKSSGELWLLQEQIIALNKTLDTKLWENNKQQFSQNKLNADIAKNSSEKIEEITKKLTSLEETNKQIKDIWGQLEWLENILKNPKQRGILGEYFLETILKNILPPENYTLQYQFKNGEIVDGALFIDDKIIPIDSKFSLENYNRVISSDDPVQREILAKEFKSDLKKRIDETSKYIRPDEGTMEFAFMFLPSEWIYYDMLVNKIGTLGVNMVDTIEYAFTQKKVIIVSPTSFYAYLQTVLQGLRALHIEKEAKDIALGVEKLWKHLQAYELYLEKLGKSLWVSVNHYNDAYKKFNQVEKDVIKITGKTSPVGQNTLEIPKPE